MSGGPYVMAAFSTVFVACYTILNVVVLLPLSYFYADSGACKFFWWLFWSLSLLGGLIPLIAGPMAACGPLWDLQSEGPFMKKLVLMLILSHIGFWHAFLLAGWWYMANHSELVFARTALGIEYDVGPQSLKDLYTSGEQPPDTIVFETGVVQVQPEAFYQEAPACYVSGFNFKCHGYEVPRRCTEEVCDETCDTCESFDYDDERCDEDGNCWLMGETNYYDCNCVTDCYDRDYKCDYMEYPDECPGYDFLSVALLWNDAANDAPRPAGQMPMALVFQVETFLFDLDNGTALQMQQYYNDKCSRPFNATPCDEQKFCGFDLSSQRIQSYWEEHSNWRHHLMSSGIGEHTYSKLNAWDGRLLALTKVKDTTEGHANPLAPYKDLPILWMPLGAQPTFRKIEGDVKDSKDDGEKAAMLIWLATTVPVGSILLGCIVIYCWPLFNWDPDEPYSYEKPCCGTCGRKPVEKVHAEPDVEAGPPSNTAVVQIGSSVEDKVEDKLREAAAGTDQAANQQTNQPA